MSLTRNYNIFGLHGSAQKIAETANNVVAHNWPLPKGSWSLPESALPSREKIPSASLFKNLSERPQGADPQLPTVAECAVHLELLQAFYYLRRRVLESEDLDRMWELVLNKPNRTDGQAPRWTVESVEIRRLKWPLFNKLAALRFLDWLKLADSHLATTHDDPGNIDAPPLG